MDKPWLKHYPKGVPPQLDYPEEPLYQFLDDAATKHPNNTALVFYGTEITYGKLQELVNRFASALQKLGLQKGDRIAFLLPNCPQAVIAFWGTLKAGCCVTSMNPLYTERELSEMLADSGARAIVVLDALYPRLKNIIKETKIEKVITTNIAEYFPLPLKIAATLKDLPRRLKQGTPQGKEVYQFQRTLKAPLEGYKKVKIDPEKDLAILQYTGGTTGRPKGVMLTHKNLVVNTVQLKHWFPLEEGKETIVGIIPFFHIGGITASLTWSCCGAARLVILPRFHTKPTLKAITKYQATAFVGVPAIYIALDKAMDENKGKYSFESLKLVGGGMAAFPRDLFEMYQRKYKKRIVEGYGLTENAGVTLQNVNSPEKEYRPGSVGFPFPDTEVKIVDPETGEMLSPNKTGEICLKGPHITVGYWNRPEETKKALKDGWLHTGDLAKMDEDGYFYILGRKDDVIGVKGFQVYPREIENVLEATGLVAEAAVVGIPDRYAGGKIIAFVVPEKGKAPIKEELLKVCRDNLAEYKVPSEIKFKDKLPRSPVQKILKYILREEAKS